jgi:hypothetical protein
VVKVSIKDNEEQEARIQMFNAITNLVNKLLEAADTFVAGLAEELVKQKGR